MTWKGRARWYEHHHKLLLRNDTIVMGKTAFTNQAGHGLITVADTPAGRLIAVVMGSNDQYGDTLVDDRVRQERLRAAGVRAAAASAGSDNSAEPPAPRTSISPSPVTPSSSDPRDDIRWSILMLVARRV